MIDYSVYPDVDDLPELITDEDKADYVARICGAWDFNLVPTLETFDLFKSWKTVFDRFPITTSAAYAAFRIAFGWESIPGEVLQADYERYPGESERQDPCIKMV